MAVSQWRSHSEEQRQNAERRRKRRANKKTGAASSRATAEKRDDSPHGESESLDDDGEPEVDKAGRLTNAAIRSIKENRVTEGEVAKSAFQHEPWQRREVPDKIKSSKKELGKVLSGAVSRGLVTKTLKAALDDDDF